MNVKQILKGKHSISVLCNVVGSDVDWVCCTVYGPCIPKEKLLFWQELVDVGNYWQLPMVMFGDFNAAQKNDERKGGTVSRKEKGDYNQLIDELELLEFDKLGLFVDEYVMLVG